MKCLNCNKEINDNSNFCEYCGKRVERIIIICSNCGAVLSGGNFCAQCGSSVNNITNHIITLTVTRIKKTMGFAVPFTVHVDGNIIGKLKNGSSIYCNVNIGKHVVNIESVEKNTIEEINVLESTNSIEIIVVAKMGFIAATAKIVNVKYK